MEQSNKARTQSRCREWERQRRNKFNEAIIKLGEVVKKINRANDSTGKDTVNMQYPKIEIVQKAIECLTSYAQEKTKLKAEILALHVQLDTFTNKKYDMKDASTQVYLNIGKKAQNKKKKRIMMILETKRNALKEKAVTTNPTVTTTASVATNVIVTPKLDIKKGTPNTVHNLPKLLPRTIEKKPLENTIVVLPAAPYLFPQRSLLFPTAPPAIVLVDHNLQPLNKHTVPIVTRNSGDITKTTMVNILPISAYSRPLSATKVKKNNVKIKKDAGKRPNKNSKLNAKVSESEIVETQENTTPKTKEKIDIVEIKEKNNIKPDKIDSKKPSVPEVQKPALNEGKININTKQENIEKTSSNNEKVSESKEEKTSTETSKIKGDTNIVKTKAIQTTSVENTGVQTPQENNKIPKESTKNVPINDDKDKENKLPAILDTTICDTTVDAGNARLELAEEFLAASPTAAFLMSFPLVSGNRADSPAEEPQSTLPTNNTKETVSLRRNEIQSQGPYFEKPNSNEAKNKSSTKSQTSSIIPAKPNEPNKYTGSNLIAKHVENKTSNATTVAAVSNDNPFLNLSMPSLISTSCSVPDTNFGLDFDCNINKSLQNQSSNYVNNNNLFYKSDPFSTVKNTIYSTSSISSSHDFNSLGLYPCAMEKYTSKSKPDYSNVEENLMKIGSSRLTYDIDLGWSHKSFDFVNCTTASNTFCKDNILSTVSAPYSTTYNPFNPDFHVPLVSSSNKKDVVSSKVTTSFVDTITSFYSQPTNLWSEDVPFYSNSNTSKSVPHKNQNYLALENMQSNPNPISKSSDKHFETKRTTGASVENALKTANVAVEPHIPEKFTKKSPTKMHINWMTSEVRPMESNCNPGPIESKDHKSTYSQISQPAKKQDHNESYFPISMHNFVTQPVQEEFQMWPSTRPVGPTEISIEPPPINLPTLVGDLALGPHDKKRNTDVTNRALTNTQDIQNCGNFLSVTQLMNRSSDNMHSRYQVPNIEGPKGNSSKQSAVTYFSNDNNRKAIATRIESQVPQPCYGFNDAKVGNTYDSMSQFTQSKSKPIKTDKNAKTQKNNYSAEALIRGGGCTQKMQDNSNSKFIMQKYNDFNTQDNSVAQVSHFPPILDYSDNSYASQQFSGTTLYNTTTNTISNSFYSNFMPGSSNIMSTMSSNYTGGPFTSEFIDYNQTDCNYTNHKYEELKMRNNATVFPHDKVPSNYKSSRRESAAKHKLECSKKDSSKKYQSKRAKLHTDSEDWSDPSHLLWQNKAPSKRHANVSEELSFPNYVGNQMPTQYQPEFFNSHLMPSNVQSVGHNVDRSISFPVTSRANFNLSTIFPEITMKVQ